MLRYWQSELQGGQIRSIDAGRNSDDLQFPV